LQRNAQVAQELEITKQEIGDEFGRQLEMVGEKDRAPAGGGVAAADTSEETGAFLEFGAGQPDGLSRDQAFVFISFPTLKPFLSG
jgi:hypothetical protein